MRWSSIAVVDSAKSKSNAMTRAPSLATRSISSAWVRRGNGQCRPSSWNEGSSIPTMTSGVSPGPRAASAVYASKVLNSSWRHCGVKLSNQSAASATIATTASMTRWRPLDCSRWLEAEADIGEVTFLRALAAEIQRGDAKDPTLVGRFHERDDLAVPIRTQCVGFRVVAVGVSLRTVHGLGAEIDV